MSKLENGEMHFTDEIIEKISRSFDVSVEDFVKPENKISITDNRDTNAITNSPNTLINEKPLIAELVKAKDELIENQRLMLEDKNKQIALLEAQLFALQKKT